MSCQTLRVAARWWDGVDLSCMLFALMYVNLRNKLRTIVENDSIYSKVKEKNKTFQTRGQDIFTLATKVVPDTSSLPVASATPWLLVARQ